MLGAAYKSSALGEMLLGTMKYPNNPIIPEQARYLLQKLGASSRKGLP